MDKFDFSKLPVPKTGKVLTDPIEIFGARPSGKSKIGDLWQGQAKALTDWNKDPDSSCLISMYTGAGKTVVGCLIAQSLHNQGRQNVLYLCPTNDLVHQTEREARSIGLSPTVYENKQFSDANFEQGKTFCITTYHSALVTRTKFQRDLAPGAMLFDDAHVGERIIRDLFTLKLQRSSSPELYAQFAVVIASMFSEIGKKYNFDRTMDAKMGGNIALCPPSGVALHAEQLESLIKDNISFFEGAPELTFDYLRGRIEKCAIFFSNYAIEICPPFIPSLHIRSLAENNIPRVFLSATVQSKGDIARAFGRLPKRVIQPDIDAGKGERVFLFGSNLEMQPDKYALVGQISKSSKVLISVANRTDAVKWATVAQTPTIENFSAKLEKFRSDKNGAFLLLGRFDGIDLPNEQCNVMVLDGLPVGMTFLETYCFDTLGLLKSYVSKLANRLAQLFGRINRGKNDHSIYLVSDRRTENWIRNSRNRGYFPDVLKEQLGFSEHFSEQLGEKLPAEKLESIINQITGRDKGWINYYSAHLGDKEFDQEKILERDEATKISDAYAKKEANFVIKLWQGDLAGALDVFEDDIDDVVRSDPALAGWYSIWLGAAHGLNGNTSAMYDWYEAAKKRLTGNLDLPSRPLENGVKIEPDSTVVEGGLRSFALGSILDIEGRVKASLARAQDAYSYDNHRRAEESIRSIGSDLGFIAKRPDNEFGTGPDCIWVDTYSQSVIGFEVKNEKEKKNPIYKKDVGQVFNHIQWISDNYPDYQNLGVFFYCESEAVDSKASPSSEMYITSPLKMRNLHNEFLVVVRASSKQSPIERYVRASKEGARVEWSPAGIFDRLAIKCIGE